MSMATRTDTQSPALRAADSHDLIRVHGARVNNLKDVSVEIPKRRLTAFTGVSGSGKSSLIHGSVSARDGVVAVAELRADVGEVDPGDAAHDGFGATLLATALLGCQDNMMETIVISSSDSSVPVNARSARRNASTWLGSIRPEMPMRHGVSRSMLSL